MGFYGKLERKFGKYAIKNLTLVLVICYAAGYLIQNISYDVIQYLTLDPYKIIHGQVWRLISWFLIPPPEDNMLFAILMIVFYFSIGTTLERTWGTFNYNMYLFMGMIFTIIGSFIMMGFCYLKFPNGVFVYGGGLLYPGEFASGLSHYFTTFYVNMSIFLAYACTFPDNEVLLMFIIPIKVKWLGIAYGAFMMYDMISGLIRGWDGIGFVYPIVIGASLLNFLLFFFTTRKYILRAQRKTKAQRVYVAKMREYEYKKQSMEQDKHPKISKHKCAICGRTERDGDDLTFRFCSKCDGNYEYCQDHLYTHIHFTNGEE